MRSKYEGFICSICMRSKAQYKKKGTYYCTSCAALKDIFKDNPYALMKESRLFDRRHNLVFGRKGVNHRW